MAGRSIEKGKKSGYKGSSDLIAGKVEYFKSFCFINFTTTFKL